MSAPQIEQLISLLGKLPAFGPRSSRRAVLHLLTKRESLLLPLISAMQTVASEVRACPLCGNMDTVSPCAVCSDERRLPNQICIVQNVADLWAIERTGVFKGKYHVLGGVLSALDGIGPDELSILPLVEKIDLGDISEVIFALPATVEGQTTVHYIADLLEGKNVKISTLSRGVPIGGELDYLDDGTLQLAFKARRDV